MKRTFTWLAAIFAASALIANTARAFESTALPEAVVLLGPEQGPPSVVPPPAGYSAMRRTATFIVTYTGFTQPARDAFQRAVNIWSTKLNSTVPIRVNAKFESFDPCTPSGCVLGSAGPQNFFGCSSGCPAGVTANTWYPVALINKITHSDVDPGVQDINARFNKKYTNWHFGTGNAPAGKIDFTSVVLHELGHGLGFIGAATLVNNNTQGTLRVLGGGRPTIYSRFVVNGGNTKLVTLADPSVALKNQLTGNNLFFRANSGTKFRLFAPNPFQPGSSYSHLNEATFPKGNANSLMTPSISTAETIRNPGPITLTMFANMGW